MDEDLPLIQRLADGDESALSVLIARHKEPLFRLAYRYTHNPVEAADITEEAFVRLYFNHHRFKPKTTVAAWLFTIAANLCKDHLRRRQRESKRISEVPYDHPSSQSLPLSKNETPASDLQSKECLDQIQTAIDALPHKLKFPFIFCILEAHSYDDCALVLKTNRKTVETRIYRARQQLRKQLENG